MVIFGGCCFWCCWIVLPLLELVNKVQKKWLNIITFLWGTFFILLDIVRGWPGAPNKLVIECMYSLLMVLPHIDGYPRDDLFYVWGWLILFRAVKSFSSWSFIMFTLFSGFERGGSVVCNVLVIPNQQHWYEILNWLYTLTRGLLGWGSGYSINSPFITTM